MLAFHLAKSTVYAVFKETVLAIGATMQLVGIPFDNEIALRKCSIQFINSRNPPSPLHGYVEAVDGLLLHITKPAYRYNPAHYFCRKGFYAIPLQVVCNSNYRVLYISMKCAGSTHDRVAYEVSALHERLSLGF
jgi:DDE superfamily endonuclease